MDPLCHLKIWLVFPFSVNSKMTIRLLILIAFFMCRCSRKCVWNLDLKFLKAKLLLQGNHMMRSVILPVHRTLNLITCISMADRNRPRAPSTWSSSNHAVVLCSFSFFGWSQLWSWVARSFSLFSHQMVKLLLVFDCSRPFHRKWILRRLWKLRRSPFVTSVISRALVTLYPW